MLCYVTLFDGFSTSVIMRLLRDLKPDGVFMLDIETVPWVLFGLVRQAHSSGILGNLGSLLGGLNKHQQYSIRL